MAVHVRVAGGLAGLLAAASLLSCSDAADPAAPPSFPAAGSAAPATSGSPAAPGPLTAADWPTSHRDNLRSGAGPAQPPARTLTAAWRAKLDGAVYGQPLVIGTTVLAA